MESIEPWQILLIVVIVLAIALPLILIVVVVRTLNRLGKRTISDPIEGTVLVTGMSNPTQGELLPNLGDFVPSHENFVLDGTATVPGMAPYPVRVADAGWTNRWPRVGDTVPVIVDRRHPDRVRIQWDRLRR